MCKRNNEPSTRYASNDKLLTIIMTSIGIIIFISLCFFLYREGLNNFFSNSVIDIVLLLCVVIVIFLLIIFGFSKMFPIYINAEGALFRTFFLKKKILYWKDVEEIMIYRQINTNSYKLLYSFIFSGRKDIELNWRVDIEERDSYDEFLQVIDYYVKKHRIKIFFKDSEFNSDKELKEIPKKLFF